MGVYDFLGFNWKKFRNRSGSASVAVADTETVVLATPPSTLYTLYVKEIAVTIITSAAEHLTFQDSAGTPVFVQETDDSPGANTPYHWVFPGEGKALTAGEDFEMVISGAGLVAHVQHVTYARKTS